MVFKMGEYNPKSKGLPGSWKGIQRRLPKTLSTFQIVILAGFLSLLILRSTIGVSSPLRFSTSPYAEQEEELSKQEQESQSRLLEKTAGGEVEPTKRNLVQKEVKAFERNADSELLDEMDAQIAEQHLEEVRAATGIDVKTLKEAEAEHKKEVAEAAHRQEVAEAAHRQEVAEAAHRQEVAEAAHKQVVEDAAQKHELAEAAQKQELAMAAQKKKSFPKPKKTPEDFDKEEAQLGEEETDDELADFAKFEKTEKQNEEKKTTKSAEDKSEPKATGAKKEILEPQQVHEVHDFKMENPIEMKSEEKAAREAEQAAKERKAVEEVVKQEDESKSTQEVAKEEKPKEEEKSKEEEKVVVEEKPLTDEEIVQQAIASMTKAIRRDEPNAFTLGPKITDWDEQRKAWLDKHPDMKTTDPHKPKVLLLSGSQPWPCNSPVGDHYLLKMIKNKVDYARIHKLETYYSFAHLDKPMNHFWAKLPLIRKMMLMRPEVEWIFWMDSDAMFTDMVYEIPFERYQDNDFVMWGYPSGIYEERSWVACNTGVFFMRNNQWSLDLLEVWSHMGPEGEIREETGRLMSNFLANRPMMGADDQSALVFLMVTKPETRDKFYLEDEYLLSGYWEPVVKHYEEFSKTSRPGAGGKSWPFTTHFTGCQPCSGGNNPMYEGNSCLEGMERAFNFADNQVLRPFGFEHENLQGSKVLRIRNETTKPIWSVPIDNPWSVQSFY